jgi:Flp pilus assembly protein TadD
LALSTAQGPSAELELGLGNLAYAEGEFVEAERHYRTALVARPDMAEAIQNLGNLAIARGDTAMGQRFYVKALILRPDNASLRAYMARLGGQR